MHTTLTLLAASVFTCSCFFLTLVSASPKCKDNEDCRKLLNIYYGVSLQESIMKYQNIEQRFLFTSNVSELKRVKSLIEIVNQQDAWQPDIQDEISMVVDSVLTSTINHVCEYLQGILSDWNEDFNCSKTELEDISSRIDIYITINELRRNDLPLEMFKYGTFSYAKVHQCNYWNNNVLNDCTEYGGNNGSDISLLQYVQETVLLGSNLCRSDQLCAIPTSQAI